ncbi:MAG: serine/threonine-protein kinase [Polyangiaceae bacterium]
MRLNGHDAFRKSEVVDLGGGRKIELAEVLGRGEGSVVYAGVLSSAFGVRRRVAVKMFPSLSSDDAEVVAEALAVAAAKGACVEHPNVVRTYEFGFFYGQPYVVMERVDGVSLRRFLEHAVSGGRRVPLDLALYVGAEIAGALDGARTARGTDGVHLGLNHLALSASEVLLSWRGEVKVADFGYSSARAASSTVRSLRSVAKRVDTMSPEVARGRKGDARSDVFSLGLLVRELLVGPRFPRGMAHDEILSLARDGHILGRCIEPDLPGDLANILHRALQVDPEDRYPSVSAMAWDLRRAAIAMGAADARDVLRRALARELGVDACEITQETVLPAQDDAEELADADVIDISPAARRRK